jgi:hypothetical protein
MSARPAMEFSTRGAGSSEWYTPPHVFDALGVIFDLDVCAPTGGVSWIPARRFLTVADDGLTSRWDGFVWMNPPYGRDVRAWMARMAAHANGIALIFARVDTAWWHESAITAATICFLNRRLTFIAETGERASANSGAPSALLGWGAGADPVARCGLGWVVDQR